MKIKTILLFLFLLFSIWSIAQNPLLSTETWRLNDVNILEPINQVNFEYDQYGNITTETFKLWNKTTGTFEDVHRHTHSFNEDNLIEYYSYESYNGARDNLKYEDVYIYEGDCLQLKHHYEFRNNDNYHLYNTYYNPVTCLADSTEKLSYVDDVPYKFAHINYFFEDNVEEQFIYNVNIDEVNSLAYEITITRNEDGLITSRLTSEFVFFYPELYTYEYDQYDNLIKESIYMANLNNLDSSYLQIQNLYDISYDENGKILESIHLVLRFAPFPTTTISSTTVYDYYCDGLLYKKTFTGTVPNSVVTYYQYEKGIDCGPSATNDIDLKISPNLSTNNIIIQSTRLLTEDSKIIVYDMSGKAVKTIKVGERIQSYFLNINDLPVGHYLVHIFNSKNNASERFVKM